MANVDIQYITQLLSGTMLAAIKEIENGFIHHNIASTTLTHSHELLANQQNGRIEAKIILVVTGVTGEINLVVRVKLHEVTQVEKQMTITSDGTYTLVVVYLPSGLPNGSPTYLEELAKLDQYSKAQYIPR